MAIQTNDNVSTEYQPAAGIMESDAPNHRKYSGRATYGDPPSGCPAVEKGVYFYYMTFDSATSSLISYVYHDADKVADARTLNAWIEDARQGGKGAMTRNPDDVEWKGPCFLAFAMDAKGWSFVDEAGTDRRVNKSLFFHEVDLPHGTSKIPHRKNETFFGARTLGPKADGTLLPVLVVDNHNMKYGTSRSRRAGDEPDHYKFDIYFHVGFNPPIGKGADEKKLTLVIDPTGKNTGP